MLLIRPEQLAAFEREQEKTFRRDLATLLIARTPALASAVDAARLDELVAQAVAAARTFGIESREQLAEFAALFFRFGDRFHEHPRVAGVLADASIPERSRVSALYDRLSPADWRAVAEGS